MLSQDFINEFADIVEVSKDKISDNFNMEHESVWDSLAFISTIALIDKHFGIVIESEVLTKINTFGELKSLIAAGGI